MSDYDPTDDDVQIDGMSDVDWHRYALGVHSRAQQGNAKAPAGDPIKWGGRSELTANQIANSIRVYETQQFIRVQAFDTYSRSWCLIGTLRAPSSLWAFGDADPIVAPGWWASLVVTQGTGQATVQQRINLRALTTLTLAQGYRTIYNDNVNEGGATVNGFEARPFFLQGKLLGNALSFRVHHLIVTDANPLPDTLIATFAEVAPLAAGERL